MRMNVRVAGAIRQLNGAVAVISTVLPGFVADNASAPSPYVRRQAAI
jgi:hypothetical protein